MIFNQVIAGFEPWTSSTEAWHLSHLSSPSEDVDVASAQFFFYLVKTVIYIISYQGAPVHQAIFPHPGRPRTHNSKSRTNLSYLPLVTLKNDLPPPAWLIHLPEGKCHYGTSPPSLTMLHVHYASPTRCYSIPTSYLNLIATKVSHSFMSAWQTAQSELCLLPSFVC